MHSTEGIPPLEDNDQPSENLKVVSARKSSTARKDVDYFMNAEFVVFEAYEPFYLTWSRPDDCLL